MKRLLGISALVLFAATGCRMCACPYDYCGPVVECGCVGCDSGPSGPYEESSPAVEGETITPGAPQMAPTPADSPMTRNASPWRQTGVPHYASR